MSNFAYQVSNHAYQGDGAFVYEGKSISLVVIDTHDGGRKKKQYRQRIEARQQLREQITSALEGPKHAELALRLEELSVPQIADSRYMPLIEHDLPTMQEEEVMLVILMVLQ